MAEANKSTFDKLVSGLSIDDRNSMLQRINNNSAPTVQLPETNNLPENTSTLRLRYSRESFLYKLLLWLRSLMKKQTTEQLYNEDIIARIAKKISHDHPGLLNHHIHSLDTIFYELLKQLRSAAEFFRPYMQEIETKPGEFYVFLSSFVSPEISEKINSQADPFINPFSKEATNDVKVELLRNLDGILNNLDSSTKTDMYSAVSSVNWLHCFCRLPFIHFTAQFTNIADTGFTSPYKTVINDYDAFASVFSETKNIRTETLEAIFLFTAKRTMNANVQNKDVESAVKNFLQQANSNLSLLQMFINTVPILNTGRVINNDYDWYPKNMPGAEAWFNLFRAQWRKVIDIRWRDWLKERKKQLIGESLRTDFGLDEFPTMFYEPWKSVWVDVPFTYELTGGFLSWFSMNMYGEKAAIMNEVMLEGIFLRSENRTEYADAMNTFSQANKAMIELLDNLAPGGIYGAKFAEMENLHSRTIQNQNAINTMMATITSQIKDVIVDFRDSCKQIVAVYHGFFDETRDGEHETLQNWMSIKGHENRAWRDSLYELFLILQRCIFYISELEPIDVAS